MKIVLDEDPMNCMEAVTVGASTMTMEGAAYLINLGAQAQRNETRIDWLALKIKPRLSAPHLMFTDIDPLQVLRDAAKKETV